MDNTTNAYNQSRADPSDAHSIPQPIRIVVILVVSLTVILTNLLNLVVLRKTRQIPLIAKVCVLNLSIADLTSGVLCMLPCLVPAVTGTWPYGTEWCQIAGIFHGTCCAVSIWSLSVVSVDRYLAVKFPLRYHTLMTPKRCVTALVALWSLGVGTFVMPIFISPDFSYYQYSPSTVMCGLYWAFPWLCIVTGIYIPVASGTVIVWTSVSVIRETSAMSSTIRPADAATNVKKMDMRAVKILSITAIVYFTAWGPYVISVFTLSFAVDINIPPGVQFSLMWLANSNSFMNVFIYSMIYKSFRSMAVQLVRSVLFCRFTELLKTEGTTTSVDGD
ncbi:5-hydroxytryptamine receptor 6-like [Liolophura sinensis]|uniref:5-hydroxytryptamine receptor 6-like n=1 Tax=Liolophura sinensis TaxID=3198878 RepID=UPI003158A4D8